MTQVPGCSSASSCACSCQNAHLTLVAPCCTMALQTAAGPSLVCLSTVETDRPCLAPSSHHIYRLLRSHRCAAQREVVGRSWLQVSTQLLADGHVLGLTFVRHSKQQLRPSNHLLLLLCSPLVATSKSTAWWARHTRLQPSPMQSRQIIQDTEAKRLRHLTISHNNFQSANLNLVRFHL